MWTAPRSSRCTRRSRFSWAVLSRSCGRSRRWPGPRGWRLTMVLARELGGGRFAQALAGLCALAAPIYLGVDSILTMNGFESLFWMGCVYFLIRIVRTGDSRLWVWFGVLAGLGLENKHSMLLFGGAVVAALLLTRERRELAKPWIWIGAGLALLLFLPNVLWQIRHGFPDDRGPRERQADRARTSCSHRWSSWASRSCSSTLSSCRSGSPGSCRSSSGEPRGCACSAGPTSSLLAADDRAQGEELLPAPIYPMLFASGAVAVEGWLERRAWSRGRSGRRPRSRLAVVAAGAIVAPAILPILPPEKLLAYQRRLGVAPPRTEVRPTRVRWSSASGTSSAGQSWWRTSPGSTSRCRRKSARGPASSPATTARPAPCTSSVPPYGLPPAICAHQNHYFWGPPDFRRRHPDLAAVGPPSRSKTLCRSVDQVGEHFHPWGMAEENRPIYLCRGLRAPLAEQWPDLKHWN